MGEAQVAARRGGTRGQRRPPRQIEAGGQRRRARRGDRSYCAQRTGSARSPTKQHSRSRPAVVAACARTWAPAAAAPSGRIECATRKAKALRPLAAAQQSASVRSSMSRSAAGPSRPGVMRSSPGWGETRRRLGDAIRGVERGHAERETLWDFALPFSATDPRYLSAAPHRKVPPWHQRASCRAGSSIAFFARGAPLTRT